MATTPATVITGGRTLTVHAADLWEPCGACGIVHHDRVVTEDTADLWFPPLPGRQHRNTLTALASLIADAFRKA